MERAANARELLIKGIIDEEDYHSIKSECESRIGILDEQLNDAYMLDVQQKQSFRELIAHFTCSRFLFEEADRALQIKRHPCFYQKTWFIPKKIVQMILDPRFN